MLIDLPPAIGSEKFDGWMRRWAENMRGGEFEVAELKVTNYATINNYRLGNVGSWDISESTLTNGTIVLDAANNRITVDTIVIDGAENEIRIGGTDVVLDADAQTIKVQTGANYVQMSPAGFVGVDSVLGTTVDIPTDGTAPTFASGFVKEVELQVYTSGVIKTAADPTATGGLLINNTRLASYDDTPTKLLEFIYSGTDKGDAYIGDYDNSNHGIKYDHSAGTLNVRGAITVTGGDAFSKTNDDLDDISDGSSYGRVASTSISAGRIVIAGLDGAARDSYAPVISDPVFALTQSDTDYSYWDFSDADITWGLTEGENGPGLEFTGNGILHSCDVQDGGSLDNYTPMSPREKLYVQVRLQKDASWDGTFKVKVLEYDEGKNYLTDTNHTITPATASVWTLEEFVHTPQNVSCHFALIRLIGDGDATVGTVHVDAVYARVEPNDNWRHSSDITTIDGGNINTASSISINSSTFGSSGIQLDYNAGSPQFYAGDGVDDYFKYTTANGVEISTSRANAIVIKSGADIKLESGGDVVLESATGGNSAITKYVGNSREYTFGVDYDNDRLTLAPDTDGLGYFVVGGYIDGTFKNFNNISLRTDEIITLHCYGDAGDGDASITIESEDTLNGPRIANVVTGSTTGVSAGLFLYDDNCKIVCDCDAGTAQYVLTLQNDDSAGTILGLDIDFANASPDDNTSEFIRCQDSTTNRLIVYSDGDVVNHDNSYGAISDEKLKENVRDCTDKLEDILKCKVRNYNFVGEDPVDGKQIGLISQELEKVFPRMVVDRQKYKTIKYSLFVPMLIKAIQELNEKIEGL